MNYEEKLKRFTQLVLALEARGFQQEIRLEVYYTVALVSHIQLALRHPGSMGTTHTLMRLLCDQIIARLEQEAPGLGPLLEAGYDPSQDVT